MQTTGAAGTEVAIQTFITGRGTSQLWSFAGFNTQAFTITANGSTASGQVTLTLGAAVTFPAIGAGVVLQFATTNPTFTPVKDLALGSGLTGVVGTNAQGRSTVTINGGGGGSLSVNGTAVTSPNLQNNALQLGVAWTVAGSNITGALRLADVVAVADSEIALKIGSVEPILTFPDISIPLIVSFPASNQMIIDVDSQQEAQLLLNKYLWRNANGTNNGTTDTLFVTAVQQQGATQFQSRITVTGNFQASGWTTSTPTIYYTTNAPAGKFTFQPPPQAEIIRLAQGAVGTANSAFNLGTVYSADNVGISTRIITASPTVSNVSGVLNVVSGYGAISITSTPWPIPIPTGGNTAFLAIEASDFSWSGIGAIQTTPSNGLVQIAWIRSPATALAGTSFTNARVWALVDAISTVFVGSNVTDATNNRPPATTLTFPNLVANSITSGADSYGGSATSVAVVPTIDNEIATLVGSTEPILTFPDTAIPLIVSFPASNQMILDVDSQQEAQLLLNKYLWRNANGTNNGTTDTLFVTSVVQQGATQFQSRITVNGNFQGSGWTTSTPTIYYTNNAPGGKYTFVPAPQAEIIRLAQANDVSSLNAVRGDVNLVAGTGIGISTSGQNITVTNTGSGGISASNFTTFINDLGMSLGAQGYVAFVGTADQSAWVGLGMDSDQASNDGGFIGQTKYLGTTGGTVVPTYGYAPLFPVAATYTDLSVEIWIPALTITFTSNFSSGWDTEFFFARASSTAASNPGLNANLFPGFRSGISDDVSLNTLVSSQVVFANVPGQANTYTCTISGGGLYSAITNNYAHTDTTNGYLPWVRITGPAITAVTNVVIRNSGQSAGNSGGYRALVALPGVGGATPTWAQTLATSNLSGPGVAAVFQDSQATPRSVSIQAPAAVATSYQLRLPTAQASAAGQALTNDGSGNLSWATGGGTPGGTNLSYQYNMNGAFAGDNAMFRDVINNRVSVFAPIESTNVARLLDVQLAVGGIRPVDPTGIPVHIAEVNVPGTYTNNSGVGSATLTGTNILMVAGVIPSVGDIVLLEAQTAGLQNGSYTVNSASYTLNIVFSTPACFPLVATSVQFTFTNVSGGSANFTMNFNANQTLASVAPTRPTNLDASWNYAFVGGNTVALTSNLTSVRWTTTPTLTVDVVPGVTWQQGIPTGRTLNALTPFLLTRTNIVPQYGNFWVATALGSSNRGVQYFNTTTGTITVGTTPIVYTIFGVPSGGVPTLDQVTAQGSTSTRAITLQPSGGLGLTLSGSAALGQPAITAAGNFVLNSQGAGNAVLITSNNSDFLALRGFSSANSQHIIDASVRELRLTSSSTTGVVINSGSATIGLRPFLAGSANYNIIDSGGTELRINSTNIAGITLGNLTSSGTVNQSALTIRSTVSSMRVIVQNVGGAANTNLSLEAFNAGQVNLGMGLQTVTIGQGTGFNTQLFAANQSNNPTAFSSGNAGQVLTSRGANLTPAWVTPTTSGIGFLSRRLNTAITVNAQTGTVVNYDTQWESSGTTNLNFSGGTFTATVAGIYLVLAQSSWDNDNTGNRITWFAVSGTPSRLGETNLAANNDGTIYTTSAIWNAAVNATLAVNVYQSTTGARTYGTNSGGLTPGYAAWIQLTRIA